jgi:hypothetical protein
MSRRDVVRGLLGLASWWLVQVPAKDVRLDDPGSNQPPISRFKKVKQFASAGECEAYRDVALQDGAWMGSDAMLDEASTLRCASDAQLAPAAATPGRTP